MSAPEGLDWNDVARGIPGTRDHDDELTKARAALNWEKHFELAFDPDTARAYHDADLDVDTDFCAMCGHDWCAVRISREITDFLSGKDEAYAWTQPTVSAALSPEQQEILERRGALSPAEVTRLGQREGVEVTGFVDDPREWLARASVSVAPLRIARGIQNKVLEALAMGLIAV